MSQTDLGRRPARMGGIARAAQCAAMLIILVGSIPAAGAVASPIFVGGQPNGELSWGNPSLEGLPPSQAATGSAITETLSAQTVIFLPSIAIPVKGFYVAANGSSRGDGSRAKPWDLETALSQPSAVKPGSTIWLRGGTYSSVSSKLKGTAQAPIIVRQFPGERAIVDGVIMAYGEYTWFWGFEITNSEPRHLTDAERGRRGPGLGLYGRGHKAINLVIYNAGHPAISFGEEVQDGEIYGCVIWGTGLYQEDVIRGSAIYGQNLNGDRLISDVISFRNFTTGMKTWSQTGGHGNGFRFEGVISFDNGDRNIFAGSSTYPLQNLTLIDNYTYRRPGDVRIGVQLGYESNLNNENLLLRGNMFVNGDRDADLGALAVSYWVSGQIEDNTIVSRETVAAYLEPERGPGGLTWRNNRFFGLSDSFWYGYSNGDFDTLNFATWRGKLGFDGSNTFTQRLPGGTAALSVFVRPNQYEKGRGHIAIYNWERRERVEVDLSGLLSHGQRFWIYDAQNLLDDPVAQGVYEGNPVSVPMNLTQVSPITGDVSHIDNIHTPVEFGAYVVMIEKRW
jgi:hypothetical protein